MYFIFLNNFQQKEKKAEKRKIQKKRNENKQNKNYEEEKLKKKLFREFKIENQKKEKELKKRCVWKGFKCFQLCLLLCVVFQSNQPKIKSYFSSVYSFSPVVMKSFFFVFDEKKAWKTWKTLCWVKQIKQKGEKERKNVEKFGVF